MKILIVDDETLARDRLKSLVTELGIGEVVGEASNGQEAVRIARASQPEVVLLDIRMPGMDGMSAAQELSQLNPAPSIIFTTAFGDRALDAFEYEAVDYLLKPIRKDRLEKALQKAYTLRNPQTIPETTDTPPGKARSHISVNVRGELRLIPVNKIIFFSADEKYVVLHWSEGEVLIGETLKDLEEEFGGQFLRIHRSTLVSVVNIASLTKDTKGHSYIKLKDRPDLLEVSRRHLPKVRKFLKDMRISGV